MEIRSQRGQTLVEYILILSVVASLVVTVYRSEAFRRLFGEQGFLGEQIKTQSEYNYRHAGPRRAPGLADVDRLNKDGSIHPSFADPDGGKTRFFGPKAAYP